MEIPIPELPSLCRHIYHRCVSLNAEHTIIGTHLCHRYGDSYTQITVIGSTYIYIYHGYISLYTEHAIIGTHLCPRYGDSYTQITVIGSTYISQMPQSMLSIQLLEPTYAPAMEIPISELPSLGRHIYHRSVSLYAEHTIICKQLWPRYGDSYIRIAFIGSTYIYHRCVSFYAEHKIIGTHLCPS